MAQRPSGTPQPEFRDGPVRDIALRDETSTDHAARGDRRTFSREAPAAKKLMDASLHRLPVLDLTDRSAGHIIGRHAIWCPQHGHDGATGFKFPFQFGGAIQKLGKLTEATYDRETIGEEVAALSWLAHRDMAPRIHRWVFAEVVVSEHPGAWWADPLGALGYEMDRAELLPSAGRFSVEAIRESGMFSGSPGAWNDLNKPGNVINGRLVDLRRSWFDRVKYLGPPVPLPDLMEDTGTLWGDLHYGAQFPIRERTECYQEFFLDGTWHPGEREVRVRAHKMGFHPLPGESVLDIGCHVGGFLHYAALATGLYVEQHRFESGRYVGLDVSSDYIAMASRLARANRMNLCFRQMDAEADRIELLGWLRALLGTRGVPDGPPGLDNLLLLSLSKHFKRLDATVFQLVDDVNARWAYLESNAINAQNPWPMLEEVEARGGHVMGTSTDRNERRLYGIGRQSR